MHAIPTRLSSEQQTGGLSATYYSVNSESQRAYPLWTADEHTVDFSVAASVVLGDFINSSSSLSSLSLHHRHTSIFCIITIQITVLALSNVM